MTPCYDTLIIYTTNFLNRYNSIVLLFEFPRYYLMYMMYIMVYMYFEIFYFKFIFTEQFYKTTYIVTIIICNWKILYYQM